MVSWFRQFCIHVSDIDATIAFYETLGLECTAARRSPTTSTRRSSRTPSGGLDPARTEHDHHDARSTWAPRCGSSTSTPTTARGSTTAPIAAGYKSVSPPATSDRWPVTLAFIEDPDGYQVELVQRDEPAEVGDVGGTPRDQF